MEEAGDSPSGEGRRAAGLGRHPDPECAAGEAAITGAALTVQKQLGLFHKRRCVQETGGETGASWGPPLGRLARNKDTLSRGVLSHQGGCKINTSGLGVLRCSPQGREIIISRPVWPPSTWHSSFSPHASPDHPSFVSKEERNYPSLFCLFPVSVPGAPRGPQQGGQGLGARGSRPASNPPCLSFTERGILAST